MAGTPDDDYEFVTGFAERLGLEDKDKDSFIKSSMTRLGYKPRISWDPPENDGNGGGDDDGDFFSRGNKNRERRQVRDDRQQQRGGGGGNWQYGD